METKKCTKCWEEKDLKYFWKDWIDKNWNQKYKRKCGNCLKIKHNYIKKCKTCWNSFRPYTSLDKFCSRDCRIKSVKSNRKFNWSKKSCKDRSGKNNPSYKHWNRENGKHYSFSREFRRNCKELDKEMIEKYWYRFCEHCWTSNSLRWEHHHIIFRSEKPKHPNLHDKENILHCCIKCHNLFHKEKKIRNDIVRKRWLDKIFWPDVIIYK